MPALGVQHTHNLIKNHNFIVNLLPAYPLSVLRHPPFVPHTRVPFINKHIKGN